jgi:hypothetical protein
MFTAQRLFQTPHRSIFSLGLEKEMFFVSAILSWYNKRTTNFVFGQP